MRVKRITSLACVLFLSSVLFAACGSDDSDDGGGEGESQEPIKVGFAMGFSGFANAFDGPVFEGARVAIDDINAEGGIDGRQIEVIKSDTGSELDRIEPAALRAIEDGAEIVVTTCDYDYGAPAARAANEEGILAIGCGGDPLMGYTGIGPLFFNSLTSTNTESAVMATFGRESKDWQSAYMLVDTSIEYSSRGCEFFRESWEAQGGEIVGEDTFDNGDPQITAQVNRIRDASDEIDVVVLCSYLPGTTPAVRQIRGGGIDLPILGQLGVDGRVISGAVQNLSDLWYVGVGSIHGDDPNELRTHIGEAYEENNGNLDVQDYAPILGYAQMQMIDKAVGEAGSTDAEELAAVLETFDEEPLAQGLVTYTEECRTAQNLPMTVFEVQNGTVEIIDEVPPKEVPEAPC